jgi:23S rRNA (cytosine1962-C5)-methyltransferase
MLHLRISRTAQTQVRSGHPWIFANSVQQASREGKTGDLAVIYDRKDRFLGIGLFDADSPIQVRILHQGKPCVIDQTWFAQNLQRALDARAGLFDDHTTGYRVINGESDHWPALILDRYNRTYVLKIYSLAWLQHLEDLQAVMANALCPERIVLRLSRNIQQAAGQHFGKDDGDLLFGSPIITTPTFMETGLHFEADVIRGQKTGFFLDQRDNRRRIADLAQGRRVLNAFSFSGGFSLYAARGKAKSVTDLDLSVHALNSAKRNFLLNTAHSVIAQCPHESIQADVFKWLARRSDQKFDLIILDPPSLAHRQAERAGALDAYTRLVADAIRWLADDGILLACSCSTQVQAADFFAAVRHTVHFAKRPFSEMATTAHAPDHPATFIEANYLKGIYLHF